MDPGKSKTIVTADIPASIGNDVYLNISAPKDILDHFLTVLKVNQQMRDTSFLLKKKLAHNALIISKADKGNSMVFITESNYQ